MRILRVGCRGLDVAELQRRLTGQGFDCGAADGYFGLKTFNAVKALQSAKGLSVDGIAGQATLGALGITTLPIPVPSPVPGARLTLPEILATLEKGTVACYEACYRILTYDQGTEARVRAAADRASGAMWPQYEELEKLRGIPAVMTSMIHSMECNNNPRGVLHNGQLIVGQNKRTTIVPIGRGPFKTWLEAALDAVDSEALWRVPQWSVGYMLKQCEKFNGLGYIKGAGRSEMSPYIWACTNINDGFGKYVSDGRFDPNASANTQVGAAAILKSLEQSGKIVVEFTT